MPDGCRFGKYRAVNDKTKALSPVQKNFLLFSCRVPVVDADDLSSAHTSVRRGFGASVEYEPESFDVYSDL